MFGFLDTFRPSSSNRDLSLAPAPGSPGSPDSTPVNNPNSRESLTEIKAREKLQYAQQILKGLKLTVEECLLPEAHAGSTAEQRKAAIRNLLAARQSLLQFMFNLAADPQFANPKLGDQLLSTQQEMNALFIDNLAAMEKVLTGGASVEGPVIRIPIETEVRSTADLITIIKDPSLALTVQEIEQRNVQLADFHIKILNKGSEENGKNTSRPSIVITPDMIPPTENQPDARIDVSLEGNRIAANIFCARLREEWEKLQLPATANYHELPSNEWFRSLDLRAVADKWHVPFAVEARGLHFFLVLTTPKYHSADNTWRYLVYDPMHSKEEEWIFKPSFSDCDTLDDFRSANDNFTISSEGLALMQNNQYDLRMTDDSELQQRRALLEAKIGKVQFDGHNCGPLCLFAALLRSFFTKNREHRESMIDGYKALDLDTIPDEISKMLGVRFSTREELLGIEAPQKQPEIFKDGVQAFVELFVQTHHDDRAAILKGQSHTGIVVSDGSTHTQIDRELFDGYGGRAATKVVEKAKRLTAEKLVKGLRASQAQAVVADIAREIAVWGANNMMEATKIVRNWKNPQNPPPAQNDEEFTITVDAGLPHFPKNVFPGMATCLLGIRYESIDQGPVWLTCNLGDGYVFIAGPNRSANGENMSVRGATRWFVGSRDAVNAVTVEVEPVLEGDRLVALTDGFDGLYSFLARKNHPTLLNEFFGDPAVAKASDLHNKLREVKLPDGRYMFTQQPSGDDKTFGMVC